MSGPVDFSNSIPNWWQYRTELYIDRGNIQKALLSWLDAPAPQHPIRSLVGPPGTGKSWLLTHIYEIRHPTQFVLQLDAQEVLNPNNHDLIKQTLVQNANTCYPGLNYPEDVLPTLPAIIQSIRERLCAQCPPSSPLVLVDGCDNLASQDEFDKLQRFLTTFFGAGPSCFLMLIARRSPLTEYHLKIRNVSITVGAFDNPPSASSEQKQRLFACFAPDAALPTDLNLLLPDYCTYSWNHPLINAFLLAHYIAGKVIDSAKLKECCMSLINRNGISSETAMRYPPISSLECEELVTLACHLPDKWTNTMFREVTGRILDLTDLQRGVIFPDSNSSPSPFYCIADGLRELLRDLAAMTQKGA